MKRFTSLLVVALVLLGLGCAQKNTRPWYGSKIGVDGILKSDFCKKYQCKLTKTYDYVDRKKGLRENKYLNYVYELTTLYTSEFDDLKKSIGNGNQEIVTSISINKSNQVSEIGTMFGGAYGPPNTYIKTIEARYTIDLIAAALGKKYSYSAPVGDANPTDDVNKKCMNGIEISKKTYRILERGNLIFEGETKIRPYVAYCLIQRLAFNPNMWPKVVQPSFTINEVVYLPK